MFFSVSVLLVESVERFGVSRMRDFLPNKSEFHLQDTGESVSAITEVLLQQAAYVRLNI